jgi:signal transduction histidine kinase
LESQEEENFTEDAVTFLTRLSDHAAIAISNALLYADLQTANIAKSEFVSLVSHELKTPMTSIRGYTDLLAQESVGPVNEIQLNFLNTIRSNVNRMANLVSDLTDVSRIEAGRMRLEFGSVSLTNIIEEVSNSVQAQLADKEHTLKVDIPENLPNVWGDYNRIIQVMNNLLSNAIKYTPQHGKIRITCQVTENSWDTEGAPQVILVSVNDSGFGISSEDNSKIFHKFFRSGDQNVRDVPGTGLGLNITRHLVEMQGGQIWFDSEHGKGSTFYFTIPVSATD